MDFDKLEPTIERLKELEVTLKQSEFNEVERETGYFISSIARYSSAYWVAAYSEGMPQWNEISEKFGDGSVARQNPPDWVYADLEGVFWGRWAAVFIPATGGAAIAGIAFSEGTASLSSAIRSSAWYRENF